MSTPENDEPAGDMRPEYDFSEGERGKFAERFARGSNVVVLAPDVAELFPTSAAVNEALRQIADERRGFSEPGGR